MYMTQKGKSINIKHIQFLEYRIEDIQVFCYLEITVITFIKTKQSATCQAHANH